MSLERSGVQGFWAIGIGLVKPSIQTICSRIMQHALDINGVLSFVRGPRHCHPRLAPTGLAHALTPKGVGLAWGGPARPHPVFRRFGRCSK